MTKRYLVIRPIVFLGSTLEAGAYVDMPEWEAKNIGIGKFLQEEAPAEKAEEKTPEELEAEKAKADAEITANAEKEADPASASAGDGSEAGAGSESQQKPEGQPATGDGAVKTEGENTQS